jgi:hypothetical protein
LGNLLFSGNDTFTAATGAYRFDAGGTLTPLPGSPATDPQGSYAAQVWLDRTDQQLISSEQFSGSFGFYALQNGTYRLLVHAVGAETAAPTAMTQLGSWLLVTNDSDGTISPCKVGRGRLTCVAPIYLPVLGSPDGIASF